MLIYILIKQSSIAMPALYFTAIENELGNIDLFGTVDGLANGTTVNLLFTDDFGNSKTATALVMDGEFSALNIWSGMFGAGLVNIMASAGGVQTPGDVELSGHHMQAPVMLTSQVLDENTMIDVQGAAPGLLPGTVLTLVIRDEQSIDVTATALVLANGSFSVQDIDPQGLSEGTLAFDVVAEDANGALNLTNIASLIYTTPGPQGADNTLYATEDSAYVVIASAFGYNGTQGRTLTGVKITQLPAIGMLKLNGVAVQTDEVISKADLDAGKLTFQSAPNGNGSDYAAFQFKVQDSRNTNNEDTTANTMTVNVAAVNDAPVITTPLNDLSTQEDSSISFVIASQLTGKVSDVDGTALKGIIVVQNTVPVSAGTWAYSSNGSDWMPIPFNTDVKWTSVLYINASNSLRFTPAADANGAEIGHINFRAVDASFPNTPSGSMVSVISTIGGSGAVSNQPGYFKPAVTAVNDAPKLTVITTASSLTDELGGSLGTGVSLFSGAAAATGPSNESAQKLTQLKVTVSGLLDGANEVLIVDGTAVSLTQGAHGFSVANSVGYNVSVSSGVATVTLTPPANSAVSVFNTLINTLRYNHINTDNPKAGSRVVSITRLSDNGGTTGTNAQDTAVFDFSSTVTVASANNSKATVDITSIEDAASSSSDTGQSNTDFVTRDGSLTYKGTVTNFKNIPGDKVLLELVSATNAVLASTTVVPIQGAWSWVDPISSIGVRTSGAYTLRATVVDVNGARVNSTEPVNGTNGGIDRQGIVIDSVVPTIAITADRTNLKAGETATVTFSLAEASPDFNATSVAVSGGGLTAWTKVSDTTYIAVFTRTLQDVASVSVGNGAFKDLAGNVNADGADSNNAVTILLNDAPVMGDADGLLPNTLGVVTAAAGTAYSPGFVDTTSLSITRSSSSGALSNSGAVTNNTDGTSNIVLAAVESGFTENLKYQWSKSVASVQVRIDGFTLGDTLQVMVNGQLLVITPSMVGGGTSVAVPNLAGTTLVAATGSSAQSFDLMINAAQVPAGIRSLEFLGRSDASGGGFKLYAPTNITPEYNSRTVLQLFGATFSDADADTLKGVAVTFAGTTADIASNGVYSYSSDGGIVWRVLNSGLSDANAVFLTRTDLVRYVPSSLNSSSFKQDLTVRLVDSSGASSTESLVSGKPVDVSIYGGSEAYSNAPVSLKTLTTLKINSVAGNDVLSVSETTLNTNLVSGAVTGQFAVGDKVTVTVNGTQYTTNVGAGGVWSVGTVAGNDLKLDADSKVEASIQATTETGLSTAVANMRAYFTDFAKVSISQGFVTSYVAATVTDQTVNMTSVVGNSPVGPQAFTTFVRNGSNAAAHFESGSFILNPQNIKDPEGNGAGGEYQSGEIMLQARNTMAFTRMKFTYYDLQNGLVAPGAKTVTFYDVNGSAITSRTLNVTGHMGSAFLDTGILSRPAVSMGISGGNRDWFAIYGFSVTATNFPSEVRTPIVSLDTVVDRTPELEGTLSQVLAAGQVVQIFNNAIYMGNATVTGTSWKYIPTIAALSTNSFVAKVVASTTVITESTPFVIKQAPSGITPLMLDLNGDGVQTTTVENGTQFDMNADADLDQTAWVSQQDGLLVMDIHEDGVIEDGRELFGSATILRNGMTAKDGFDALRDLDSNEDGIIDASDPAFENLRVWVDANGNGVTDAGELKTLQELNIVSFQLQAEVSDVQQNGNALGLISSYTTGDGQTHDLVDVWLNVEAQDVVVAPQNVVMGLASLGALFSDVTPALSFSAVENEFGNINIMGSALGMANGTAVNLLLTDALGNSTTATATVMAEEFSVNNLWAGMFGVGNVSISAMAGGVQASESLPLERNTLSMPIGLTSFALDENLRIDAQGFASSLESGTVLTLVIRDVLDNQVIATAVVQADGAFSVQNIDTQGLSEGILTLDVIAQDDNALLNLTSIASVVLPGSGPQGSDTALNATEDIAFVLSAANFGYASTQGHALTGVKITKLPANGTLKLNGVTVQTDDVISKADLDAGKLRYQGALNGNGSNYASFQFKVQDSRAINNEDITANTLTFNLAAVNDAPVLALAIPDQVGMKGAAFNYTVPANAFVDVDSTLTYSATMADGSALPSWLSFNSATRTFSGTPSAIGNVNLLVKVSDGSTTLSDAFVLSVGDSSGSGINLSTISAGVGGFVIDGGCHSAYSGFAISGAGDVNGDGLDDMIVSAYGSSGMANPVTYVVFGKSNLSPVKLSALGTQGFEIRQEQASDKLGQSVSAAGDVNGDGLADLLVSANEFDPASSRYDAGRSYVVFGKASTTAVQLANVSASIGGYAINGHTSLDFSGRWLSSAGDVNGDGLADFIVGAYKADAGSVLDVGRSYVVYGKTASNTAIELSALGTGGLVINGTVASDYSGWSVSAAGDVNGDGYADVIVGAYQADPNGTSSGRSYVVFGKPGGGSIDLANVNNGVGGFAIQGERTGDLSGYSVSSAGDVNGDGLADVIVGAPEGDSSGLFGDGRSFVVFGKTSGTAVQLTNISNGVGGFAIGGIFSNTDIGYSVSSAGDINGDGLADLLVGAPEMTLSTSEGYRTGQTYVVYGKANGSAVTVSTGMASSLGFAISGEGYQDLTGRIVSAAGDVNGDGLADLMISANTRNVDGYPLAGRTYVILGSTGGAFKTAVDLMGTTGDDTLTSTGTQTLMAAAGHDTLVANGADVLHGGSGNDVFSLGTSTITALANGLGAGGNTGQLARVVGGTGFDTIRLTDGAHLDLTQVSNSAASSQVDGTTGSRIDSIERIDLGTDTGANTLTLSAKDVREMAGFNAIRTDTVSADGGTWTNAASSIVSGLLNFEASPSQAISSVMYTNTTQGWELANGANSGDPDLEDVLYAWVNTGHYRHLDYTSIPTSNAVSAISASFKFAMSQINSQSGDGLNFSFGDKYSLGMSFELGYTKGLSIKYGGLSGIYGTDTKVRIYWNGVQVGVSTSDIALDSQHVTGVTVSSTGAVSVVVGGVAVASAALSNWQTQDKSAWVFGYGGRTGSASGSAWVDDFTATASTAPLSSVTSMHQLMVDGAANDTLVLSPDTGFWTVAGTVNNGTSNYTVYQNSDTRSQVLVKSGVVVTNNDSIAPVVLDLNADGQLSYSRVNMDVNGDGRLDKTAWAGGQDGVLVWDKLGDGKVHDNSQYAFSQYGKAGSTDLQGLAEAFDTNHDGMFDAQDVKFAEFKVWQDMDQDGVSDVGELRSLVDWGITSIHLISDGVSSAPAAGVFEAGQAIATTSHGTHLLVADAAFAYSAMDYSIDGGQLSLQGSQMNLHLSSVVSQHGAIDHVDLSGLGANTLQISSQDVLSGSSSGRLRVTGNADDTVQLDANAWTDSGFVVYDSGHSYAVFNANQDVAAQLLLDKQLLCHVL